jgi:Tol biopolymer transport system component/DNA-binding SARP family transcriptional activator
MIELRMLGGVRLLAPEGRELDAVLRQPKRLAVLAYLTAPAPGTWHRRDTLLALFWPELDTAHARTALRNAIYVLRQALGDDAVLARGDEEVAVNPEMLHTDLAAVLAALREGRLDDALAGYGGELLPGLYPADSEGFLRWLDGERDRLQRSISDAAIRRVGELEREGELARALTTARRLLEIQPDDETVVRRVMTLHQAMSDTAGALRTFEKFRAQLAADFEAAPSAETSQLAERLRGSPPPRGGNGGQRAPARTGVAVQADPAAAGIALATVAATAPGVPPAVNYRPGRLALVAAFLVGISIVSILGWAVSRPHQPQMLGAVHPLTVEDGLQVEAAISPNGRLVAYAKGNVSRLRIFVQRTGGGPAWPLSGDSLAHEILPRWSPDNDRLVYLSRNDAWVAPSIGGTPRILARGTSGDGMVRSVSWSPGGDSVAIVRHDSLTVQALDGGQPRFVGRGNQLHSCTWSPDGRWIACVSGNWVEFEAGPLFGNIAQSTIVLFAAAGGPPTPLTDTTFQNRSPAWSADGRYLWVVSNRDGPAGEVFAIPIGRDGRPSGPAMREGLQAEWISLAAHRLAYTVPQRRANIWAVPVSAGPPVGISAATPVTTGNQIIETVSTSMDGRWLVYDSNLRGNADVYRMLIAGGPSERLTNDPRPEFAAGLSPDDSELAWHRWVEGQRHVFLLKVGEDSAREILAAAGDVGVPRWSPDGRSLAAWGHRTAEGVVLVAHRDSAGGWREAWRMQGGQLPVWSPDGQALAYVQYDGSVMNSPSDSGRPRTVYAPRPGADDPTAIYRAWSGSRDTLWFLARDAAGRGSIWALDLRTGARHLLVRLNDPARLIGLTMATDQRRFYFTLDERLATVCWGDLLDP